MEVTDATGESEQLARQQDSQGSSGPVVLLSGIEARGNLTGPTAR